MIFWIVATIAAVIVVGVFVINVLDDGWGLAFLEALLAAILAGVVGVLLVALATMIPGEKLTQESFELRAISTSSSIQGRFFLGSGYVDGKRTLNYIAQEAGWSRLGQGNAASSRIFEGVTEPTVTEYTYWYSNGWVLPFDMKRGSAWDFHVPADSILEDFTITNE